MSFQKAPVRLGKLFHTDVTEQVLYVQKDLGLKTMFKVKTVADMRLREGYATIPVPVAQLRKILALRQNKEPVSRNGVRVSNKPTPPGHIPSSQLTRTQRRARFKFGFAPLSDWWPRDSKGALIT